jgi:hypothetical protein
LRWVSSLTAGPLRVPGTRDLAILPGGYPANDNERLLQSCVARQDRATTAPTQCAHCNTYEPRHCVTGS